MRAVTVLRCWGLFLLLFLLGCQSISETAVAPTPQTAAALVLSDAEVAVPLPSITPPPQSTEQPPTFTPLPVPTATATLQPTALPIVAVAVPEAWQPVLQNFFCLRPVRLFPIGRKRHREGQWFLLYQNTTSIVDKLNNGRFSIR